MGDLRKSPKTLLSCVMLSVFAGGGPALALLIDDFSDGGINIFAPCPSGPCSCATP